MSIFSKATVKMARRTTKVLAVLTAALLAFIWIHSMMPPEASGEESSWVTMYIVQPVISFLTAGRVTVSELFVRKLAHFSEYAVYAFLMTLTCGSLRRDLEASDAHAVRMFCIPINCWITAFMDETIQIFSGRGPAIVDVWIDVSGAFLGFAVALLIVRIAGRRHMRLI